MSEQQPQSSAVQKKAWYLKWWVLLIAAFLIAGGIGAAVNPSGDVTPAAIAEPRQRDLTEPNVAETPAAVAPLDLEKFLTESGFTFDSVSMSAGKAYIYVPTETTNELAQKIGNDAMLYLCDHAAQAGDNFPAANRVEVSDGISPVSEGYHAVDHPSGFATDDICDS
ncbi:hypothetical protein QWJ90_06290 [Microbacterium oryzae]|uniref:hypothetical protein n=1 Tax=Microbacterium oryzae TaxID=743009 RepID=UPI0025B1AA0E|nr:hypothetical protein [Microbacterium oryzae]MDN3310533.1 hypothetical protein [Microbacterium oryzae]